MQEKNGHTVRPYLKFTIKEAADRAMYKFLTVVLHSRSSFILFFFLNQRLSFVQFYSFSLIDATRVNLAHPILGCSCSRSSSGSDVYSFQR